MQKITFLVLLAIVALTSASLSCCGRDREDKDSIKVRKTGQSKLKLNLNFGENEVQPESVVKILEAVRGINWQKVGTSFVPVGQPAPAPPTYVNINGRKVSAADLATLLEILTLGVNWPQFSSSVAASSHGYSTASNPGSQKINIGEKDFDAAHVVQLLEHIGNIDWKQIEKSIEAANAGAAQQSNSVGQNDLPRLAKLLEQMGGIDWKKIESLVEGSAKQLSSSDNNVHGNAGKNAADSQPSETIPKEPEHHNVPKESHNVPEKTKKLQTNVQRLVKKWSIPPLVEVEQPHSHCKKMNCKHCAQDIFYGEEVSAPHVTKKINRVSTVNWKSVGSK